MLEVMFQVLPFFAVIGVGYGAARSGFFSPEATVAVTRFVFYFALSAMLFRFSANLTLSEVWDWDFIFAYLLACTVVYAVAVAVALIRKRGAQEAAVEAQCAIIGNTGFLGIPMLAILLGDESVGYNMLVLAVDLVVFASIIVIVITGVRDGRLAPGVLVTVGRGLLANPMIMAIGLGFTVSGLGLTIPAPVNGFLVLLGNAATPGALFAIGASLADKSAERIAVAGWLSFLKLFAHPAAVAIAALWIFEVDPYPAAVMIAASALPVAGNIYILAQHYGVAAKRVSAAIFVSTAVSVITVPIVIAWVLQLE